MMVQMAKSMILYFNAKTCPDVKSNRERLQTMKYGHARFLFYGMILTAFLMGCATDELSIKKGEAARNLGEAFMAQSNFTAALREFLAAEKIIPDDPYLHNNLGLVYMAKKRFDSSVEHFKKAISLKPGYASAINNLGIAYMAQENYDSAIECFTSISKDLLYTTPHFPLSNLGLVYFYQKKYDLSEKAYLEALRIEPGFLNAINGLSRTYQSQGKFSEAILLLEEKSRLFPKSADLFYEIGKVYADSKNHAKALEAYSKVLELTQASSPMARDAQKAIDILKTK